MRRPTSATIRGIVGDIGRTVVPDVYAAIADADRATQARLADILELRASDPQQRVMLESYLAEIAPLATARVLEIGCGTGAVVRVVAGRPGVAEVVGIDPSPVFIAKARELAAGLTNVAFEEGDGRSVRFEDRSFDVVIFHTTLSHIPSPEALLAEAFRVLRSGGWLAVFDGDYASISVATGDLDPLQACLDATLPAAIANRWLVQRLPILLRSAGFELRSFRSHGYLAASQPAYMLTLVDRAADRLAAAGRIGEDLGAALKVEARRRVDTGEFFGFMGFASAIAHKPEA